MTARLVIIALLTVLAATPAGAGTKIVGHRSAVVGHARVAKVDPDLSQSRRTAEGWTWSQTVLVPGASFLKIHLVNVNLRSGDELIVRKQDGRMIESITGRGPKEMGSFWALSVPGDSAYLEFRYRKPYRQSPFTVDKLIAGDANFPGAGQGPGDGSQRSICGQPDFEDAICYQNDSAKWSNVQASVGVMTLGANADTALYCSGANVSPRNFVLTNNHCVPSQASCDNTEFVFRHYRTGCNNGSPITGDWVSYRCGEIVAAEPLVECDASPGTLDFSLASVLGEPSAVFGHAQPDITPLSDGEALYIVQHPDGRPHEITHGNDTVVDGHVLRYRGTLDTESGSSGSPIFRESDDALVGLHHCGGCSNAAQGNRGMLMTDLHPLIEPYLCTESARLVAGETGPLTELAGNGNGVLEVGETWSFVPSVLNAACSGAASNVTGAISPGTDNEASLTLLDTLANFPSLPAGDTADALSPVRFQITPPTKCGDLVAIDMAKLNSDQGVFPGENQVSIEVGAENFETLFFENFASGIPGNWTIVNLGTGIGPAETWTTDNPGNRLIPLVAPFAIGDSDLHTGPMDEELQTPPIDATGYLSVSLQFTHDFRWYFGSGDEQADIDVRSSATFGGWINVANFSGADASGTVNIDISQWAADDLQIRFRYYNALFDWWWAIDDITVLGSTGFDCLVPGDTDSDGVLDELDNCLTDVNPGQVDSDTDGIGNACDADIGPVIDCQVNFADLAMLDGAFFTSPGDTAWNPDADFNEDDIINFADLLFMRQRFFLPPGPSGVPNECD